MKRSQPTDHPPSLCCQPRCDADALMLQKAASAPDVSPHSTPAAKNAARHIITSNPSGRDAPQGSPIVGVNRDDAYAGFWYSDMRGASPTDDDFLSSVPVMRSASAPQLANDQDESITPKELYTPERRPPWVPREWTKIPQECLNRVGAKLPRVWSEPCELNRLAHQFVTVAD